MKSATQHKVNRVATAGYIKTVVAMMLFCIGEVIHAQDIVQYVQPLAGTAPSSTMAALKHSEAGSEKNANTIPAVTLPFAMTQWTPQTREGETKCVPPYFYKDSLLTGFRATHWISGSCMQDYGSFTVMPVAGNLQTNSAAYAVPLVHEKEVSTPYSYTIETDKFVAEMTATLRCGMLRFTMKQDDSLYILIKPNSDYAKGFVKVNAQTQVVLGYNPVHRIYQGWGEPAGFNGWFYVKIDRPFKVKGTFGNSGITAAGSIQDQEQAGAYIGFYLRKGEQLTMSCGTSFTSWEGCKKNIASEIGSADFTSICNRGKQVWEKALKKVQVSGNDEKNKRIFYTALYHTMQHPRLYDDVDGKYPRFAGNYQVNKTTMGHYYDDFSMWDIYRAQLPLFEILKPSLINDCVRSIVLKGEQGGWLPVFPCWNSYTAAMIGDHATVFIASAYNKGIRNYNIQSAYRLMRKNAFEFPKDFSVYKNGMGRRALYSYRQYGFIPMEDSVPDAFHKKEQVSRTLEYAYDDYALSTIAGLLGKQNDYKILRERAFNYQKIFDTSVSMVRGRYADGRWYAPFRPDAREVYITEGTPRQYTFYVPHDMTGLAKQIGGDQLFEKSLDSLFIKNEYWHGNEPGHQIPFLYNFTSSPWKTQEQVRRILQEEYSDGPGGLSGNDDAGQMSAWFVFAASGFYPVDPVSGNYQLCSPLFDTTVINTETGKKFSIIAHKQSPTALYINKVKWNGQVQHKNFITYKMITQGGELELWLADTPTAWGGSAADRANGLKK